VLIETNENISIGSSVLFNILDTFFTEGLAVFGLFQI